MGGANAITPPEPNSTPEGSSPSSSLILTSAGYALPTAATTDYYVNPLNLATDPITDDVDWVILGTSGVLRPEGGISLIPPRGSVTPSWDITIQATYLPSAAPGLEPSTQVINRLIRSLALSTRNENGNSTGVPLGTLIQATVMPLDLLDNLEIQIESQFSLTFPGSTTGDPFLLYPVIEHNGTASATVTLYELTLKVTYTGDVPSFAILAPA